MGGFLKSWGFGGVFHGILLVSGDGFDYLSFIFLYLPCMWLVSRGYEYARGCVVYECSGLGSGGWDFGVEDYREFINYFTKQKAFFRKFLLHANGVYGPVSLAYLYNYVHSVSCLRKDIDYSRMSSDTTSCVFRHLAEVLPCKLVVAAASGHRAKPVRSVKVLLHEVVDIGLERCMPAPRST